MKTKEVKSSMKLDVTMQYNKLQVALWIIFAWRRTINFLYHVSMFKIYSSFVGGKLER